MKKGKNTVRDKFYDWLLQIYPKQDISSVWNGLSAPYLMIRHSVDCQYIEITSYSNEGKHYSGWYFMPLSFQAFEQRLTFNNSKL